MSPKELLYVDDALGHAQFMEIQCREAVSQLQDPALKEQAQTLVRNNHRLFQQFFNLV